MALRSTIPSEHTYLLLRAAIVTLPETQRDSSLIPPLRFGCTCLYMHRSKRCTQQVRDTSGTQVCPPIISLLMICHLDHTHELMQALTLSSPRLCHVCTIPNACISFQPVAALMTANGGEISKKAAFSLSASSSLFQVGCREAEHSFISQTNSICKNKTFQCCSVLNP